jgi:hypothetical protein
VIPTSIQTISPASIYQLRITLNDVSPLIWRRLLIKNYCSIADLHDCIQIIMDWSDTYLNQFRIHGKTYGVYHSGGIHFTDDAHAVKLKQFQFRLKEKFIYEYNFFHHWKMMIRVEELNVAEIKKYYPICIDGKYAAPPEDCGGPDAFMELCDYYSPWRLQEKLLRLVKRHLITLKKNKHENKDEHDEGNEDFMEDEKENDDDEDENEDHFETLKYWVNRYRFDRRLVNQRLREHFHSKRKQAY